MVVTRVRETANYSRWKMLGMQSEYDEILIALGENPHLPSGDMVDSLWFLDQSAQHLPTGYIVITFVIYSAIYPAKTLWVQVGFFCKVPSQAPTRHI